MTNTESQVAAPGRHPLAGVARDGIWNLAATLFPRRWGVLLAGYLLRTIGAAGYAWKKFAPRVEQLAYLTGVST